MAKSWFGWFGDKQDSAIDRRAALPQATIPIGPDDIDPITGALYRDRFEVMLQAEQAQAPGVLLVIDLSERSARVDRMADEKPYEILPWLAQAIRQAVRPDDLLAHIEGFRFAVLLRGAPREIGEATCDRILESVDSTIFMTADGMSHLDVTIGGKIFAAGSADAFAGAMAALGRAMHTGQAAVLQ